MNPQSSELKSHLFTQPDHELDAPHKTVWVHGASLGDINALSGLVDALLDRRCTLYLSATTRSGRARWSQLYPDINQRTPPLWSPLAARETLKRYRPDLLILELLEIWPAWVMTWVRAGVSVVVVDGRISARTLWAKPLIGGCMKRLSLFLAQTSRDAERAERLGVPPNRIVVCGDAKLDSVMNRRALADDPPHTSSPRVPLAPDQRLIILGCLRPRDEAPALSAINALQRSLSRSLILIAPRHLERVKPLIIRAKRMGFTIVSYGSYVSSSPHHLTLDPNKKRRGERAPTSLNLIVLDRYGVLSKLYEAAHLAIIGGTFFDRGQNLIEAAVAGCAVIHGPRTKSIRAQRDALSGLGGHEVNTWRAALELSVQLLTQPREEIGVPKHALSALTGALDRQLACLDPLIFES